MDAHCSNCATPLTPLWIFCPHCGTAVPHETQNAAPPEHVPARGAFGGLIYGVIAAPILIVAGMGFKIAPKRCQTAWILCCRPLGRLTLQRLKPRIAGLYPSGPSRLPGAKNSDFLHRAASRGRTGLLVARVLDA